MPCTGYLNWHHLLIMFIKNNPGCIPLAVEGFKYLTVIFTSKDYPTNCQLESLCVTNNKAWTLSNLRPWFWNVSLLCWEAPTKGDIKQQTNIIWWAMPRSTLASHTHACIHTHRTFDTTHERINHTDTTDRMEVREKVNMPNVLNMI